MKKSQVFFAVVLLVAVISCAGSGNADNESLAKAFEGKFYFGAALNRNEYTGGDQRATDVIKKHFNAIVAENDMKSMYLQPEEGVFFFDDADRFVEFGEENGMFITGHTLIWHSQAPAWFFIGDDGEEVTREVLIERMRDHIHTVVGRYKGRIKGWDVVNETILDNGDWRPSPFYRIIGEDFVKYAFRFANEADPDAELYYNDYSMALPGRREGVIAMVKALQEDNIRIDGIGMQGHVGMDGPSIEEFEKSLLAFSDLGVNVMITELDLSPLPSPWGMSANITDTTAYREQINPYKDGLPAEVEAQWEERYLDFYKLFLRHSDKITRVTLWGISDATSWKNNFPVRGRTDYPLLFDRDYKEKPIVSKLIDEAAKSGR